MTDIKAGRNCQFAASALLLLCGLVSSVGCQVSVAGQTLPSPYYLKDDVQYFPAGPENKLANETAALKRAQAEAARSAQNAGGVR
ncbi:MAG: hypothetical protein U0892_21680 [Pirellulales bacterium]